MEVPTQARRWTCLQEASDVQENRVKFWDGCGMGTHAIIGRRVSVDGIGTGNCTGTRQARLGGGIYHRIAFDNGFEKEMKLLHAGPQCDAACGDVAFFVEDEQAVEQPWRWSDDPRFAPPQPGESGNLTPVQAAAIESFRQVAEAPDVDDIVALRFLRANGFDVPLAKEQWAATLAWRKAEDVDSLMETQWPPSVCKTPLLLQGLYPHMMAGYDRGGRPVRVECMGRVRTSQMYQHTTEEEIMRYHTWQNEEIQQRFLPAASRRTNHVQTQVTVVLDMAGAKLGDLLSSEARAHIKNFVQVTSDYYPEILHTMLIINAPRLLSMAWDFVAPLLDAGTKRKITIAPPGIRTRSLLHTVIHPSQLPIFLGGELQTPLDRLLPVIDGGGGPDDFESISDWDGYWGLATTESSILAAAVLADGSDRDAARGLRSQDSKTISITSPQVSGQPSGVLAGDIAETPGGGPDDAGAIPSEKAGAYEAGRRKAQLEPKATAGTENIYSFLNRADDLIAKANWVQAEKMLLQVMKSGEFEQWQAEPDDYAELHEILASCLVANGDYEAAIEQYSEGLKHRPDGPRLRLGRGKAYARLGQLAAAKSDLDFATALRPTHEHTTALAVDVARLLSQFRLLTTIPTSPLGATQEAQQARIQRMVSKEQGKVESTSSAKHVADGLAADKTNAQLVKDRATAYFANVESLRVLALQILQGSPERPGYRAADDVGDDWQINCGDDDGTGGASLGAHVRIARDDLSAAIGRMKTGVEQKTVIEALNALYGSSRTARIGVINPAAKSEVEWADVENWWSVWASKLCARTTKNPGTLPKRTVKLQAQRDSSGITFFTIEVFEPNAHDDSLQRIAKSSRRYSEFDAVRSELIVIGGEVAELVKRLPFPPKSWGIISLTDAQIEERRVGLESWVQNLVTKPLVVAGNGAAQQRLQSFINFKQESVSTARKVNKMVSTLSVAITDI